MRAPATAAALDARLAALRADGPPISGGCIPASAPAHRRGALIASLHVLCRLRGEPAPLETSEQLEELSERCGGLLGALHDAWYDGDGALRPEFAKPKKGKARPAMYNSESCVSSNEGSETLDLLHRWVQAGAGLTRRPRC